MTNRTGAYVPLSAQYFLDERIDAAGEAAELLYIRGLAFCAGILSDGYLTRSQAVRFAGAGLSNVDKRIEALVKTGLWIPAKDGTGYRIRAWQKWNRPKSEIEARRDRDAARKRAEREGSPGVSYPERPNGVRKESARSPNGVRKESAHSDTDTADPPGHYVSRVDQAGVRGGGYAREAAPAGAAAQEPPRPAPEPDRPSPRYGPPTPEAAAEIAAVLAKANNRRLGRRAADGFGAP